MCILISYGLFCEYLCICGSFTYDRSMPTAYRNEFPTIPVAARSLCPLPVDAPGFAMADERLPAEPGLASPQKRIDRC